MSLGKRIKHFRLAKGLTQKSLGVKAGLNENAVSAALYVSGYENDLHVPREPVINRIAAALDIDVNALDPDINTLSGIMHTFFLLEDEYGLRIARKGGELRLSFDPHISESFTLRELVSEWMDMSDKLNSGEISKEEYDNWRYRYSENT